MPPRRSKSVSTAASPSRDSHPPPSAPPLRKTTSKTNKIVKTKPDSSLYTYFTVLTPPPQLKHEPPDDTENLDLFTDANGLLPPVRAPLRGITNRNKTVVAETPRRRGRRVKATDGDNVEDGDWRSSRLNGLVVEERRQSARRRKVVNMALPPLELEFEEEGRDVIIIDSDEEDEGNVGVVGAVDKEGNENQDKEEVAVDENDDSRQQSRWSLRKRKRINMALPPLELEFEEEEEEDTVMEGEEDMGGARKDVQGNGNDHDEEMIEDEAGIQQPQRQRRRSPRKRKVVNMALPPLELEFEEDTEDEEQETMEAVQEKVGKNVVARDGISVPQEEGEAVESASEKIPKKKTDAKKSTKTRGKGARGGRGGGVPRGGRKTPVSGRKGVLKGDVVPTQAEPVLLCVACVICGLRLDSMTATESNVHARRCLETSPRVINDSQEVQDNYESSPLEPKENTTLQDTVESPEVIKQEIKMEEPVFSLLSFRPSPQRVGRRTVDGA